MGADPRVYGEVQDGTRLRDAAVDPRPTDFLPPTNAGLEGEAGNPHGPNVISPQIHGDEAVHTIRPGLVAADTAVQSTEETAHLVTQQPTAADQTPVVP